MAKYSIALLFLLGIIVNSFSQNLEKVDSIVLRYPGTYKSVQILAKRINNDFDTDVEKVRATYTWITQHIAYSFNEGQATTKIYNSFESDFQLSQDMGQRVLKTKHAICSGYSQLFQSIMNELGITSHVVTGSAKTEINDIGKALSATHAWNIVTVDDNEYLIDATWGAGSWDNGFIKDRNYHYFFTPPVLFARKHFPKNPEDLLLDNKITSKEFSFQPLYYAKLQQEVTILNPKNGVLLRKPNHMKYRFSLETALEEDWISCHLGQKHMKLPIEKTDTGYTFTVDLSKNPKARTLIIYFGGEALAGYRIK